MLPTPTLPMAFLNVSGDQFGGDYSLCCRFGHNTFVCLVGESARKNAPMTFPLKFLYL